MIGIQIKNAVFSNNNNKNKNIVKLNEEKNKNSIDFTKTFVLPQLGHYTEKIKHTLHNKFQINTIFRYPFKLDDIIKLQKDKLENDNRKNHQYTK